MVHVGVKVNRQRLSRRFLGFINIYRRGYQAVSGVLIGGGADGALRMALGGGTGLTLLANADAAWAPVLEDFQQIAPF
ncbi:hypothetical protein ACNKFW_06155 [Paracoccus sp. TD-10]|uniref:hypothetical protein n=1 Tax=Paracoccus TaxID=265 RepID=UPI00048CFCD6|nr:hypothetical protein [Paracoccus pantotrophus]RDD95662.1 hypothetical protein DTW92_15670 [Paracoccus pantotrophus]WGR66156.1 hypothetical protein E3U24_12590 [Paracoccus pantotrophus]